MSIKNVLEESVVNIFNAIQGHITDNVISKMISTFKENDVEIDYESFKQFFPDIENYEEIVKYFEKPEVSKKSKIMFQNNNGKNKGDAQKTCDYVFTKGQNKGDICGKMADQITQNHSRCNKHKNYAVGDVNDKITLKTVSKENETENKQTDIKALLAKIKAAKENK